jgi:hypothetical protein
VLVVSPHSLSRPWVREPYEALLRQAVEDPPRRLIPELRSSSALRMRTAQARARPTGPCTVSTCAIESLPVGQRSGSPQSVSSRSWPLSAAGIARQRLAAQGDDCGTLKSATRPRTCPMTASTWTVPSPAGTITGVPQRPARSNARDGTSNGHPATPAFKTRAGAPVVESAATALDDDRAPRLLPARGRIALTEQASARPWHGRSQLVRSECELGAGGKARMSTGASVSSRFGPHGAVRRFHRR